MMKERALRVLEFTKILDMLASYAVTDMGREACTALTPLSDLAQVNEALDETEEAQVILTYLGESPLIGFPDVRSYLTLAAKGAALNPKFLLNIAECLRAARAARSALVTETRRLSPALPATCKPSASWRMPSTMPSSARRSFPTTPARSWPISAATSSSPTSACAKS